MIIILTAAIFATTFPYEGVSCVENRLESIPAEINYYQDDNDKNGVASEMDRFTEMLSELLSEPWNPAGLPLLYIEEEHQPKNEVVAWNTPWKRTRYYRRYPWKRQNSRTRPYEADNRYMCQPTREDVFKLLVALHETRAGNGGHSINFCNRRRSADSIFTNIRFLGRRRK